MRRVFLSVALVGVPSFLSGQVVFDGSLESLGGAAAGLAAEPLTGQFEVRVEDGVTVGENLFHRFSQLDLANGQSATFLSNQHARILAAVTSGNISEIDGILKVVEENGGESRTDLFLLNPAGIILGSGAKVDIGGDFFATTANRVRLGSGAEAVDYYVTGLEGLSFSSAAPEAFGFLGGAGAARLDWEGASLSATGDILLAASEVNLREGRFTANGYDLTVVAIGEEGELLLGGESRIVGGGKVEFEGFGYLDANSERGGQLEVHGGEVEISRSEILSVALAEEGGGISINGSQAISLNEESEIRTAGFYGRGGELEVNTGGTLSMESGSAIVGGTGTSGSLVTNGDGGFVSVTAQSMIMDGRDGAVRISVQANEGTLGDAGEVRVIVLDRLEMLNGATILGDTRSDGRAANVTVEVGSLLMDRGSGRTGEVFGLTQISASSVLPAGLTQEVGEAGQVNVSVLGAAQILNNARISATTNTESSGGRLEFSAGSLTIRGPEQDWGTDPERDWFLTGLAGVTDHRNGLLPGGRGGDLAVQVEGDIRLERGGQIDSSSFGAGAGGNVAVTANRIFVDGMGSEFFTGIGSDTEAFPDRLNGDGQPLGINGGAAGGVFVAADQVNLTGGGLISASTTGSGRGGDVTLWTRTLNIAGEGVGNLGFVPTRTSGVVAIARESSGRGGDVRIGDATLPEWLSAEQWGNFVRGLSDYDGVEEVLVGVDGGGGAISAEGLGAGDSGTVYVRGKLIRFENGGAALVLNSGGGQAGDVVLDGNQVTLRNGGRLEGSTSGLDDGGNVLVVGSEGVEVRGSRIAASAGGDGGGISVQTEGRVYLVGSEILAEAGGDGGNIEVTSDALVLNGTQVSANAREGRGGRIDFTTGVYLSGDSIVTATGGGGDGEVVINAEAALSGGEDNEVLEPLDASDELQEECTKSLATEAGSFIVAGKGGTKRLPGGYLPSLTIVE